MINHLKLKIVANKNDFQDELAAKIQEKNGRVTLQVKPLLKNIEIGPVIWLKGSALNRISIKGVQISIIFLAQK